MYKRTCHTSLKTLWVVIGCRPGSYRYAIAAAELSTCMHHYAPACVAPNVHATSAAWRPPVLEMIMISGIGTADQEPGLMAVRAA